MGRENRSIWVKGRAKRNNEGDVDMAATNWRKGEGTCVGRGMQKRKKTTAGGKMGSERANKTNWKSKNPTKNLHHIPKLLTLQGLPHMSAHPRHMWVHRDNLIDYGRILQHRRHLLEELGRVHHRLHLQCASDQYEYEKRSRAEKHDFQRIIFGSFGFNPMSPNGFNPAMAPNPI